MLKALSCDSIANLDNGLFGQLVNSEIEKIREDLSDRGHDGLARELTIKIQFKVDVKRDKAIASIDPMVQAKLPALRSNVTAAKFGADRDGEMSLLFRDDNAERPDQPTLLPEKEES